MSLSRVVVDCLRQLNFESTNSSENLIVDVLSAKLPTLHGPKGCIGPEDCQLWHRDQPDKNFAGKSFARPR